MKIKNVGLIISLIKTGLRLFALPMGLLLGQTLLAAVTFNVTPPAVSNTYNGTITLQIGGLTNKTVVIQKFLDLNTNGVIDGGDLLVQQFTLQDGTNFVIGGVTNFNVPGDLNATTGAITATLNFQNGDFVQNIVGNYLYVLSSPGGHFAPITNQFAVTNFPFAQTLTGNVVSNSTSTALPNAIILMFPPPRPGNKGPSGNPSAGVVANNAGSYTVQLPTGTYMPVAFEGNYAANMATAPVLTLAASQTITTNLTLTNATTSISGSVVDANNSSIGLPGVMIPAMSSDGLLAITFTDTNGNFNVPVTAGTWTLQVQDSSLIVHGYVGLNNGTNVSAGATGVTLAVPRATALFYGSVTDNLGYPMAGIDVEAYDTGSNLYGPDGYTDTNGNYFLGIVGGLNDDPWQIQISSDKSPANYIFSQPDLDSNGGTNINSGQAVLANFTALLAANYITGNVKANGTNIVGVGVNANATINSVNFSQYVDTDANGNYSMNVANGNWNISLNCNGGDDSLDNILGSGNYQCPDSQNVTNNNSNGTANFIVQPCGGISIVTASLPAGEIGVYYDQTLQASSCNIGAYNWTLIGGSLPSGLTLGSNGEIYGINDASGTYTFTVQVTDSGSLTTNGQFSIAFSNAVQITTTTLPDGTNGSAYSQQLQAAAGVPFGGASPYSWSLASGSASLPPNLTLAANGLLSGTLAASDTFDFTVEVTDSLGGIYDQPLALTIVPSTNSPLTTLYTFSGGDGSSPNGLVQGSDGNFYGTTEYGGAYTNQYSEGLGTVFKMTPPGTLTTLYSFSGIDGAIPAAGLVQGANGYFYGTTEYGGVYEDRSGDTFGSVFKIMTNGTFTSLYSFSGSDGANPDAGLVQGADGNFYGTTSYGGVDYYLDDGTVFKITANGSFTSLISFSGSDGIGPGGGLVQGTDGNFYGTTEYGGTHGLLYDGYGTVFKMTTNGTLNTLYSFTGGGDGANPAAGLVQGADGNFYGTAEYGGTNDSGTVFKIMTNGTLSTLYSFTGGGDGANPAAGLVQGTDGNFYGTTEYGGAYKDQSGDTFGTVFKITSGGTLTTVYSFTGGSNGAYPNSALVQGTDGNFYGTTSAGGAHGDGAIFRLSLVSPPRPVFQSVTKAGGTITLTWSALAGQTYQLQFKTNLNQTSWNNLGSVIIATNSTATALDSIGPDPQRFYRVKIGP
ncbi:MAG: choice-of-anchor tandem repeat GloVer-containing protein [Verrucomicrobiota bacterium]|jgi:uncharacterized repeat protein (TIGR03803 family)